MIRRGWGALLLVAMFAPTLASAQDDAEVTELQGRLQAQQAENERLNSEYAELEARLERLQARLERYRQEMAAVEGNGSGAVVSAGRGAGSDAR